MLIDRFVHAKMTDSALICDSAMWYTRRIIDDELRPLALFVEVPGNRHRRSEGCGKTTTARAAGAGLLKLDARPTSRRCGADPTLLLRRFCLSMSGRRFPKCGTSCGAL